MKNVVFCLRFAGASPTCPEGRALRRMIDAITREIEERGAVCKEIESVAARFFPHADGEEEYLPTGCRNFSYASPFLDNGAYPHKPYRVLTTFDCRRLGIGTATPPTANVLTSSTPPRLQLKSADKRFTWVTPCGWEKEVHVLAGDDEKRVEVASWLNNHMIGAKGGRFKPPIFLPALSLHNELPALLRCVLATLLADHLLDNHVVFVYLDDGHAMFGVFRSVYGVLMAITDSNCVLSRKCCSAFRDEGIPAGEFGAQVGVALRDTMHAILPSLAVRGRRSTYV